MPFADPMDLGTLFELANMHLRVGYLSLRCANEKKNGKT